MSDLAITPIPAFTDNYFWLLARGRQAVVVDPGDAAPVQRALDAQQLTLAAILVTHHPPTTSVDCRHSPHPVCRFTDRRPKPRASAR